MNANILIHPDIFGGQVRAFFTGSAPGVNRRAICELLEIGDDGLFMPVQKHTSEVLVYTGRELPSEADAVITNLSGIALGVKVADCVPILLSDEKTGAIGAVHAGWRGTAKGILPGAIRKMAELYGSRPADIKAAIGPSIKGCCYEVGIDVLAPIKACFKGNGHEKTGHFIALENGKTYLDLGKVNGLQALHAGVKAENIWTSQTCTCCNPERFYSYRREGRAGQMATGQGGGRQGGFIMRF